MAVFKKHNNRSNIKRYGVELNKTYNKDCLIGMKKIKNNSIDMILCDLPYGLTRYKWDVVIPLNDYIEIVVRKRNVRLDFNEFVLYCYDKNIRANTAKHHWGRFYKKGLWTHYKRILKDNGVVVLTASQAFTAMLINSNKEMFKYTWCWQKTLKTNFLNAKKQPLRNHEDIVVFYNPPNTFNPQGVRERETFGRNAISGKNKSCKLNASKKTYTGYPISVLKIASPNQGNGHPSQKPVALFEYLIKTYSNEDDVVLDNCMGSGTTAVACLNNNRKFIGYERDVDYFKIAVDRSKLSVRCGLRKVLKAGVNRSGKKLLSTVSGDKALLRRHFSLSYNALVMWCFLFTVNNTYALNLGQVAHVFAIYEQDFTAMMKNKLSGISTEEWQAHQKKIVNKTKERVNRPDGVSLPRVINGRSFNFDPGITTTKDILGAKGEVLIPRGTKSNPLDFISLSQSLLLIDGDDEEQVAWGNLERGLLILVQGEPLNLSRELNRPVYFDQYQKIIHKFGIESVPARVSQKGNQLLIEEIKL